MKKGVFLGAVTTKISSLEFRIKEVAEEEGVLMKDLARKVGIDPSYLSRINSGRITPNMRVIEDIADALKCPPHRLISAPKGYGHFYVDNEWHGIRKK